MPVSTLRVNRRRDVLQGTARQRIAWKSSTATKFGDGHEVILFFLLLLPVLSEDLLCQAARQKRAGRWPRLTAGRIECNFPRAVCMAAYRGGRDVCRRGGATI